MTAAGGNWKIQEVMLQQVAAALGPELLREVAFVGGCTTGLLITDAFTREAVRFTDDVDVIVHVLGPGNWHSLQQTLSRKGFRASPEDEVICRTRLRGSGGNDLVVDFMPDDEAILGFGNRWYAEALQYAGDHALPSGTVIRVVTPPYFLGTKLEAFRGRGNNDPLASRDIEDILNVVDGRPTLGEEIGRAPDGLRRDIAAHIAELLRHRDFEYAVQAAARNNRQREDLIFQRLETIKAFGG
ncbi:MAG: hypothetical protein RL684_1340 [Pseudomonadota bacterium]|jgi:hypothetical protein|nr:nucleotidyl transferase AbiEii/AbiGii toxin family protein [Rhodanobacteraceae bacterium]